MNTLSHTKNRRGFTMVELLIVISVIGIMSALVIAAFSNAAQDTRRVISRQQQAAVQSAVNAWVTSYSAANGLSGSRTDYNAAGNSLARLQLVGGYLDDSTLEHFVANTDADSPDAVLSAALDKTGQFLLLGQWASTSYPKVELK